MAPAPRTTQATGDISSATTDAGWMPNERRFSRRPGLTPRQIGAVQYAIHLFMEEDLERGISATSHIYCDGCARHRLRAGAIPYGQYLLCNLCAAQFEVARAGRRIETIGQFIRDKQFGEAELYALPPLEVPVPTDTNRAQRSPATEGALR